MYGPVAQLVEQRIENPRVGGSIPPQATKSIDRLAASTVDPVDPELMWPRTAAGMDEAFDRPGRSQPPVNPK